jgi:hypothetical protein
LITTIKYIFSKVPKIIRWLSVVICIAPVLTYIVQQFALDKPIELSLNNLLYLATILISIIILGFIIGSFISVRHLLKNADEQTVSKLNSKEVTKKLLPHRIVSIGTYKTRGLSTDIRANILLNENVIPTVDMFLDRIYEGTPYCTKCDRPLNKWNAGQMAAFAQIGYHCTICETQIKGDWSDLRKSIKAEVRKNYDYYWKEYHKQIEELTGGDPEEYELPPF